MFASIVRTKNSESNPPANPIPFAPIPVQLLADRRLNGTDVKLAGALLTFARSKAKCWPSIKRLAAEIGKCPRTVRYSLRKLEETGWITTEPSYSRVHHVFILNWRLPNAAIGLPGGLQVFNGQTQQEVAAPVLNSEAERTEKQRVGSAQVVKKTEADIRELYASWLEKPEGDPLRTLAERRIADCAKESPALT